MNRSEIQRQIEQLQARVQDIRAEIKSIMEERSQESDDARRKWLFSKQEEVQQRGDETWAEIDRLKAML